MTTRSNARSYFDDLVSNIDWSSAPTPKKRPRLLGITNEAYATVELFGPPKYLDEIAYQSVFEGTSGEINYDRALPMIRVVQKYVSRKAAEFVVDELDYLTTLDAIPAREKTRKFGNKYVRFLSIDVVNAVNVTITIGHKPSSVTSD